MILGYIDWCNEDYLSMLDIQSMGKALGIEDGEYKYYWLLDTSDSPLTELVRDTDVLKMAQSVGPSRVVNVEATVEVVEKGMVVATVEAEQEVMVVAQSVETQVQIGRAHV